jgi:hypothetical protein
LKSVTSYLIPGVALCLLLGLPAWPQASTGAVRGTVSDPSGAFIPNATVTLTNTGTNVSQKTMTNDAGYYLFPGVIPGPYRLAAEARGMQKFEGEFTLQVQQDADINVPMKVGQTSATVVVEAISTLVTTDNATLGHVLEQQRIEQLPINGRNLTSLLVTVPGMEDLRAYGMRYGSAELVLDGSNMADRNYGDHVVNRQPSLDTIQEFKVEDNGSSAKYTRPSTIVASTKSGTNQLHGTAFETARNWGLGKARQRQDTYSTPPKLIRNEFGVSGGGPVYIPKLYNGKNKTFWFFGYEGYRNINPSLDQWPDPTDAMRNGDFSGLLDSQGRLYAIYDPWSTDTTTWERVPYPGNKIPSTRESPLAKYLFSITPEPTLPNINPLLDNNWVGPDPNTSRQYTLSTRIDHRFSDRDFFYGRYTQGNLNTYSEKFTQAMLNGVAGAVTRYSPNHSLALSAVHNFSPTLFNEVLASVNRETWWLGTGAPGVKYADQLGLPNPFNVQGWPGLYTNTDGLYNGNYYFETDNTQATYYTYAIFDDNATKIHGKHELQFGFHHRFDQLNTLPDQQQPQGNHSWNNVATALYDPTSSRTNPQATAFTGYDVASMYLGLMNYSNQFVRGMFYMRAKEYAGYFQDKWKVTPKLTLNLGMRYEYWPPYTETNRLMSSFDPKTHSIVLAQDLNSLYRLGATRSDIVNQLTSIGVKFETAQQAGLPRNMINAYHRDWGPRLGFAWRMGDKPNSPVLRGGYRISYFPIPLRTWHARMRSNAPLTARFRNSQTDASLSPDGIANYVMRTVPTVIAGVNSRDVPETVASLAPGSPNVSYFDPNEPDTRVQDWNVTLEKEVSRNMVARLSYVGNHVGNLEQYYQFNNTVPAYIWYVTTGQPLPTGSLANVATRPFDNTTYGTIEEFRKIGWSNWNGVQVELERRYWKGVSFQLFYVMGNAFTAGGQSWSGAFMYDPSQFLPGAVPADFNARNRFLNYNRDTSIPKHRVRWNWLYDLPVGRGKALLGNAHGVVDKVIGGWQVAGLGNLRSTYFSLPTGIYPNGNPVETYGYQYPVQDCRAGACHPGYLWWNGYISPNQINSVDPKTGLPNGVEGVPANYKPAGQPLIVAGTTTLPANAPPGTNVVSFWNTNTVWIPLNNGTVQRIGYNNNLHPWRQQYFPSILQWGLDASLFKVIPITERLRLRFNADFFNVLNHPGNPNSVGSDGILQTRNSGQGARELQLTLRLSF